MPYNNRVKVTATGTINMFTLGVPVDSFQAFVNDTTTVTILADDNTWQVCNATIAGTTLTVNNVEENSADTQPTALDFTGKALQIAETLTGDWANALYSSTETDTLLDAKVDDSQVLTDVPAGAVFTDTVYDDSGIQSDITDLSAQTLPVGGAENDILNKLSATDYDASWATPYWMNWKGSWTSQPYLANDVVLDGRWLMVANKDTTDPAAPQTIGDIVYGVDTTNDSLVDNSVIYSGNEYVLNEDRLIQSIKAKSPVTTGTSEFDIRLSIFTSVPGDGIVLDYKNVPLQADTELEFTISPVAASAGQTVRVSLSSNNATGETSYTHDWTFIGYSSSGVDDGEWGVNPNGTLFKIAYKDDSTVSRKSEIDQISVGSRLIGADKTTPANYDEYEVTEIRPANVDDTSFVVELKDVGGTRLTTDALSEVTYTIPTASGNSVSYETNWWSANTPTWATSVTGLLFLGSVEQGGVANNAYAIDFGSTGVVQSDDWDVLAYSGILGVSGGSAEGTNLDYTPSPSDGVVTSDTGDNATILAADGVNAGLLLPAEKTQIGNTSGTNTGDQDLSTYDTHIGNTSNPHSVTAAQAGAVGNDAVEAGASSVVNCVFITQANYDLLTPVATTLYIING